MPFQYSSSSLNRSARVTKHSGTSATWISQDARANGTRYPNLHAKSQSMRRTANVGICRSGTRMSLDSKSIHRSRYYGESRSPGCAICFDSWQPRHTARGIDPLQPRCAAFECHCRGVRVSERRVPGYNMHRMDTLGTQRAGYGCCALASEHNVNYSIKTVCHYAGPILGPRVCDERCIHQRYVRLSIGLEFCSIRL